MGNIKLSLSQKFAALLAMFVTIIAVVLFLFISAKNEPIDFARQELKGTVYQTPIERSMRLISLHRVVAQRALYGEKKSQDQLPGLEEDIDKSLNEIVAVDKDLGGDLQFTDQGLKARKREHYKISNVIQEWSDLKQNLKSKKPAESNDLHAHLVSDLRNMITHLGDTSNLILDPDLDSYYLMDITLLALPQTQDRIQNITVEMEPIVRRKNITLEERIKASAWVAMMSEADLERIKGDFQTVLNEDPNFYGKSETLEKNLTPLHQKFVDAYGAFIALTKKISDGQEVGLDEFLQSSNEALEASYAYWHPAEKEMETLLKIRHDAIYSSKIHAAVWSVLGLLASLVVAWFFIRYLTKNMRSIVELLSKASESVYVASNQSATLASSLSDSSNQQAAGLQQTVASLEEISSKVGQNAESAIKAKSAADENQRASQEGAGSVDQMMTAISNIRVTNDEISQQMEASNREFAEIVKIISEIGTKTTVINEIVFQTRLLSFNASVEAARAGEHGKGFAVVAEEVGNLAQMSGDAAKEISDMLESSITKVNAIVENTSRRIDSLVEAAKGKIVAGEQTANTCKDALTRMSDVAQSIASMVNEIAQASQEQSQGISEINKAIAQLDDATQQNSSVASQSSSEAEKLNSEATKLTTTVKTLRLFVDGRENAKPKIAPAKAQSKTSQIPRAQKPKAKPMPQRTYRAVAGENFPSPNDPGFAD